MSDTAEPQIMWEAPDRNWRESAACRGCNPELFHPLREKEADIAKAFCSTCPVIETCLEYAIRNDERFGVWGGTSERDRRKLKRERREQDDADWVERSRACGTNAGYMRHYRNAEQACTPCLIAHREYVKWIVARLRQRQRQDAA